MRAATVRQSTCLKNKNACLRDNEVQKVNPAYYEDRAIEIQLTAIITSMRG